MSAGDVFGLAALLLGLTGFAAILAGAYKRRLAFLERKLEITASATAEKAAQYAAINTELENRVRVLERIVTEGDTSRDIAFRIEALCGTDTLKVTAP